MHGPRTCGSRSSPRRTRSAVTPVAWQMPHRQPPRLAHVRAQVAERLMLRKQPTARPVLEQPLRCSTRQAPPQAPSTAVEHSRALASAESASVPSQRDWVTHPACPCGASRGTTWHQCAQSVAHSDCRIMSQAIGVTHCRRMDVFFSIVGCPALAAGRSPGAGPAPGLAAAAAAAPGPWATCNSATV